MPSPIRRDNRCHNATIGVDLHEPTGLIGGLDDQVAGR